MVLIVLKYLKLKNSIDLMVMLIPKIKYIVLHLNVKISKNQYQLHFFFFVPMSIPNILLHFINFLIILHPLYEFCNLIFYNYKNEKFICSLTKIRQSKQHIQTWSNKIK